LNIRIVVSASGLPIKEREKVYSRIKEMGGKESRDFTESVTHLVTEGTTSEKYKVAVKLKKYVVNTQWIDECWKQFEKNGCVSKSLKEGTGFLLPPFIGCIISVSGLSLEKKEEIAKLTVKYGGKYSKELTNQCTHLITEEAQGTKYIFAEKNDIFTVYPAWFYDCIDVHGVIEEANYIVVPPSNKQGIKKDPIVNDVETPQKQKQKISTPQKLPNEKLQDKWSIYLSQNQPQNLVSGSNSYNNNISSHNSNPFFKDFIIFLGVGFSSEKIKQIEKWISSGKGRIVDVLSDQVTHYITLQGDLTPEDRSSLSLFISQSDTYSSLTSLPFIFVQQAWLRACYQNSKLVATTSFEVSLFSSSPQQEVPTIIEEIIRSDIFSGKVFGYEGFSRQVSTVIETYINRLGGTLANINQLVSNQGQNKVLKINYLIVPFASSKSRGFEKNPRSISMGITDIHTSIMTEYWLERCFYKKKVVLPTEHVINTPCRFPLPLTGFEDCTISTSGFEGVDREHLEKLIIAMGAKYTDGISKKNTHLICVSPQGGKFEFAMKWSIPVIEAHWIFSCLTEGKILPIGGFTLPTFQERSFPDHSNQYFSSPKKDLFQKSMEEGHAEEQEIHQVNHHHISRSNKQSRESDPEMNIDFQKEVQKEKDLQMEMEMEMEMMEMDSEKQIQDASAKRDDRIKLESDDNEQVFHNQDNGDDQVIEEKKKAKKKENFQLSNLLEDVIIFVSPKLKTQIQEIHQLAASMGAKCNWSYDSTCTHLIHQSSKITDNFKEFRLARNDHKFIVSPHWLLECRENMLKMREDDYPHTFNPSKVLSILPARISPKKSQPVSPQQSPESKAKGDSSPVDRSPPSPSLLVEKEIENDIPKMDLDNIPIVPVAPKEKQRQKDLEMMEIEIEKDQEPNNNIQHQNQEKELNQVSELLNQIISVTKSNPLRSKRLLAQLQLKQQKHHQQRSSTTSSTSTSTITATASISTSTLNDTNSKINSVVQTETEKIPSEKTSPKRKSPQKDQGKEKDEGLNKKLKTSDWDSLALSEIEGNPSYFISNEDQKDEVFPESQVSVSYDDRESRCQQQKLLSRLNLTPSPPKPPVSTSTTTSTSPTKKQQQQPPSPKKKPYKFILSSFSGSEKENLFKIIQSLGGTVFDSAFYESECTHVVVKNPSRSEKYFAACASGKWVLHHSYLLDSFKKKKFLDEEEYEWKTQFLEKCQCSPRRRRQNEKLDRCDKCYFKIDILFTDEQLCRSPQRWRTKIAETEKKAFSGWTVFLTISEKSKEEGLIRLLQAGDAQVLSTRQVEKLLLEKRTNEITYTFYDSGALKNKDQLVRKLNDAKVCCLSSEYISEYLTQENPPEKMEYDFSLDNRKRA